jgi:hypothetical protein
VVPCNLFMFSTIFSAFVSLLMLPRERIFSS